jgi:hypothetical protein
VHVWLTTIAWRAALAVQQLMQRTLRRGGERWRTAVDAAAGVDAAA